MSATWDRDESALNHRAARLRATLESDVQLDTALQTLGRVTVTGSVALRVMVARDVDLTVSVPELGASVLADVGSLAAKLIGHESVRQVVTRDDTGSWNVDPGYPDGIYLGVSCRDQDGEPWSFDIWFVDQPDRQPDLAHLRSLGPRITPATQRAILAIKRATQGRRADGSRLPSYEIYRAVLDEGIRTPEEFAAR